MTELEDRRDEAELKVILRKLRQIKEQGFGSLEIIVQNGQVTYTTVKIGEQMKLNIE